MRIAESMKEHPDDIVFGCRNFDEKQVPTRNKMGNKITAWVFKAFFGMQISDAQTGLRGFPRKYLKELIDVEGERYEYESNMLMYMSEENIPFSEISIQTVYSDDNSGSDTRPPEARRACLRALYFLFRFFLKIGDNCVTLVLSPEGVIQMIDYRSLAQEAEALVAGVPHPVANLSNLSALIMDAMPDLNWAGFYLLEGETLVLGPFQGKPACIEIPVSRGVCGAAVREDRPQLVPDVHAFQGHIACDCASRSELVIPMHSDGRVVAVLDLDSPSPARFDEADRDGLLLLVRAVEPHLFP